MHGGISRDFSRCPLRSRIVERVSLIGVIFMVEDSKRSSVILPRHRLMMQLYGLLNSVRIYFLKKSCYWQLVWKFRECFELFRRGRMLERSKISLGTFPREDRIELDIRKWRLLNEKL